MTRKPKPNALSRRERHGHFFDGSTEKGVAALLGGELARISPEELDRLARLMAKSRKES